jgi:hypothetical protein
MAKEHRQLKVDHAALVQEQLDDGRMVHVQLAMFFGHPVSPLAV